jgi:TPR repeat protein
MAVAKGAAMRISLIIATLVLVACGRKDDAAAPEKPAATAAVADKKRCADAAACKTACDAGDPHACVGYARRLAIGDGVAKDPKQAHVLFESACDKGVAGGCLSAGTDLVDGVGVLKDSAAGVARLKKACDLGNEIGCVNYAEMLYHGEGVAQDQKAGAALFAKGCDAGNVEACLRLGGAYTYGHGVDKDVAKGTALFQKACDAKIADGCWAAGTNLDAADPKRSAELFQLACDLGSARGCWSLGVDYRNGTGVAKDKAHGDQLLDRACKAGQQGACDLLAPKQAKVSSGGGGNGCGGSLKMCGGRCVDIWNDDYNCRDCGISCVANGNSVCWNGSCVSYEYKYGSQ